MMRSQVGFPRKQTLRLSSVIGRSLFVCLFLRQCSLKLSMERKDGQREKLGCCEVRESLSKLPEEL